MPGIIDHFVVVMLENRSFDNVLGWTYAPDNPPQWQTPKHFIPPQDRRPFDGLSPRTYWNETAGPNPQRVYATRGTTGPSPYTVPAPDPQELFDHMNFQQFETETPNQGQAATMGGFLKDYATRARNPNPEQIMETYSPEQLPAMAALARGYAVSDRWFGSVPCQTWPNRAFVHAGTSCGRVNNCDHNEDNCIPDPGHYDKCPIFNVLEELGHSWTIYNDTVLMSLARAQFIEHLALMPEQRFRSFDDFKQDAAAGTLPKYSFLEPSFIIEPNDQHPPHHMLVGDKFIHDIFKAVSRGPKWGSTLLLITYDEHGGCYDHRGPKWTATPPDNSRPQQSFGFNRWGPRVPAILVSPLIEAGTVFRSPLPDVEYDHTAVLATLRDWLGIPPASMLKSKRIQKAPTLFDVLTLKQPRTDLPDIEEPMITDDMLAPTDQPLNAIQKAVIAGTVMRESALPQEQRADHVANLLSRLQTEAQAVDYLRGRALDQI